MVCHSEPFSTVIPNSLLSSFAVAQDDSESAQDDIQRHVREKKQI